MDGTILAHPANLIFAERMAEHGAKVTIIDRRSHIGGNAYDFHDDAGVLIHRYGPHIFHTNSEEIHKYLSKFTKWRPYEHRVLAEVRDQVRLTPGAATLVRTHSVPLTLWFLTLVALIAVMFWSYWSTIA